MAFWSERIEPKRVNRWYILFGGTETLDSIAFALKSVEKPKPKQTPVVHKFANHNFKYPGRVTWDAIPIKFASVTEPDATVLMDKIKITAGYKNPSEIFTNGGEAKNINYSFLSKDKYNKTIAGNNVNVVLNQVNADGFIIESWNIYHPFFTDVKFGTLDYGSDGILDVECTMRYDWAELKLIGKNDKTTLDVTTSLPQSK